MVTQTRTAIRKKPSRVAVRPKSEPTWERIVTRINQGEFDEHLRAIVRACFYRREELTGESHVESEASAFQTVKEPEPVATPTSQTQTLTRPALADLPALYHWFHNNGEPSALNSIEPIDRGRRYRGSVLTYNKRRYRRDDLLFKKFPYPAGLGPQALMGVQVGIVGASNDKFKLLILGTPLSAKGSYMEKWRQRLPFFVSKNALMPYLSSEPPSN